MRIVDLSQDIDTGVPVYPGHLKTVLFDHSTHEETRARFDGGFSYQTKGFLMNDNGPTHVDSFSHLDPDPAAETIDQMPLGLFFGEAICIDVSTIAPRTDIEPADLDSALAASGQELRGGDILLLYTATYNRHGGTPAYLSDFPGLGAAASQWLVDHQVKTFGVDSCTPDNPASTSYPCHMMCRRNHITHYENLANLDQVAGARFLFAGFPLRLKGAHGGPTRAVAILDRAA
jgi:kynurenine formamidase